MIKCIAIDDEPLALQKVAAYIKKTPFLESVALCESAMQALEVIENNNINLMFVDINMPDLNGMDFVKSLHTTKPLIVFTTAYSEYAIEGFKVDALDYLLKPFEYAEFLRVANKAKQQLDKNQTSGTQTESNDKHLFIKSEHKIIRIEINNITYVEGMREYVRIHMLNDKPIMTLMSMKKLEEDLPKDRFMRVHRSYIVNLNTITTIERNRIIYDKNVYIPISEQYKEEFKNYVDKYFL